MAVRGQSIELDIRCADAQDSPEGTVAVVGIAFADPRQIVVPCGGIRPAAVLERQAARPREPRGGGSSPGWREDPWDAKGRPIGPAALLALAAVALVGGALIARRLRSEGPEPPGEGTDGPADADVEPSPPVLTLVPMPRERAP